MQNIILYNSNANISANLIVMWLTCCFINAGGIGELSLWCSLSPKHYYEGICFYIINTSVLKLLEHCLILIQGSKGHCNWGKKKLSEQTIGCLFASFGLLIGKDILLQLANKIWMVKYCTIIMESLLK